MNAQELSRVVVSSATLRQLEDGPYGGVPIYCGDAVVGEMLDAPIDDYEGGWGAARILDASVAQVAHSLSIGELRLPAEPQSYGLPITQLNQIAQRGVDHQFFVSAAHKGPFI